MDVLIGTYNEVRPRLRTRQASWWVISVVLLEDVDKPPPVTYNRLRAS